MFLIFRYSENICTYPRTTLKLENLDDFIDSELENVSKGQVAESECIPCL